MRANNRLQLIQQVTMEFRFRKDLAQKRFKSNKEFRYQNIVSSVKFRNCFAKFMIRIVLRYRMAGITESAMVAYTHKYAVV